MKPYQCEFLDFVIAHGALRFGEFKLKSGRKSPYFFNAGSFNSGGALMRLGEFYAHTIADREETFDMLFGPAYKGIPLVSATAIALAHHHRLDLPYAFNRKEIKDHGEGGGVVGARLEGRVAIIDDVVSAGLSVANSVELIRQAGASAAAVFIALDRQEQADRGAATATQAIHQRYQIPVYAIVTLSILIEYLAQHEDHAAQLDAISCYQRQYGVIGGDVTPI